MTEHAGGTGPPVTRTGTTGSLPAMADEQGETPVDIKPRSRDVTDWPNRARPGRCCGRSG